MAGELFRYSQRVNYALCTMGNHVYYSKYLEILEAARGEFFRALGHSCLQWQERGFIFPVIECHLRYKAQARYDDVLAVAVWVELAEKVRLNFGYRVMNQNEKLVLEAETYHVCTGLDDKPKRLPEDLRASVREFVQETSLR